MFFIVSREFSLTVLFLSGQVSITYYLQVFLVSFHCIFVLVQCEI